MRSLSNNLHAAETLQPGRVIRANARTSQRRPARADAGTSSISNYCRLRSVVIISAALLGVVLVLHFVKGVPFAKLTKDPVAIADMRSYVGFLSQAGIFFWSGTAMACLFCANAIPRHALTDTVRRFFLASGLFTLCLGIDDAFLMHEEVLPHFGVPQNLVLFGYTSIALVYLFVFRRIILETDFRLIALALLFFAISVVLDVFEPFDRYLFLFEDGAKLIGLVSWTAYFVGVAGQSVSSAIGLGD